ncbi:MAG: hypothetical protein ACM3MF_00055 [Anaerolineae bacterium]
MSSSDSGGAQGQVPGLPLKKLSLDQIKRLDAMLASLGDYGEIHLIVQHGELRYINKVTSYKAWKDDDNQPPGK